MNHTNFKPNKVNHMFYIFLLIMSFLTLFISFLLPEEKHIICKHLAELIKNLSYGCVASTFIAWLIDCTNVKHQNKQANSIYNAVYCDLKVHIANHIETWAQCCAVLCKGIDYYNEKNTWLEWYKIFKEAYKELEPDKQTQAFEFLVEQLAQSVKEVRTSLERIQSQQYVLTINNVIDSDMNKILADFRFEFYALQLELERADRSEMFWAHMDAITDDLVQYIGAWRDIGFFNNLKFKPYKFWDDFI